MAMSQEHPKPPNTEEGRKGAPPQEPGEGAGPAHTADFGPPGGERMNSRRFTPPSLRLLVPTGPGKLTQLTSIGVARGQTNSSCHAPALTACLGKDPHRGERVQKPVSPEPPGRRYRFWRSRCGRQKCPGMAADLKTVGPSRTHWGLPGTDTTLPLPPPALSVQKLQPPRHSPSSQE